MLRNLLQRIVGRGGVVKGPQAAATPATSTPTPQMMKAGTNFPSIFPSKEFSDRVESASDAWVDTMWKKQPVMVDVRDGDAMKRVPVHILGTSVMSVPRRMGVPYSHMKRLVHDGERALEAVLGQYEESGGGVRVAVVVDERPARGAWLLEAYGPLAHAALGTGPVESHAFGADAWGRAGPAMATAGPTTATGEAVAAALSGKRRRARTAQDRLGDVREWAISKSISSNLSGNSMESSNLSVDSSSGSSDLLRKRNDVMVGNLSGNYGNSNADLLAAAGAPPAWIWAATHTGLLPALDVLLFLESVAAHRRARCADPLMQTLSPDIIALDLVAPDAADLAAAIADPSFLHSIEAASAVVSNAHADGGPLQERIAKIYASTGVPTSDIARVRTGSEFVDGVIQRLLLGPDEMRLYLDVLASELGLRIRREYPSMRFSDDDDDDNTDDDSDNASPDNNRMRVGVVQKFAETHARASMLEQAARETAASTSPDRPDVVLVVTDRATASILHRKFE